MAASAAERLGARHTQSFLHAANGNTFNQDNFQLIDSLWSSNTLLYAEAVALPLAFWFRPVVVCIALFWLTYRASHVLNKPLDELASLLGFDIPLVPRISLAGIKSDGAIIHWSLPEKQKAKSTFKYEIHLNGAVVDSASMQEEAVLISGLQPNTFYIVRIAVVNNLDFSSKSAPIRFRTKPASSNNCFHVQNSSSDANTDASQVPPLLRVKPYRGLKDVFAHLSASSTAREAQPSTLRKRSNTGWRTSPASTSLEVKPEAESSGVDVNDGGEMIEHLTERLDQLRREHHEAERQAREEEEEEQKQREDLVRERDELRADVAEKEKISRNLKKEVNTMERQNTAAQNERSKLERTLQQRVQERAKYKQDAARWAEEAVSLHSQAKDIDLHLKQYAEQIAKEKTSLQERLAGESAAVKSLDDEIRETAAEIKKMDRAAKDASPGFADAHVSLVEQFQQDAEEDRQHNLRKFELQNHYAAAVQKLEQSKRFYINNLQYLEGLRERRRREEEAASAIDLPGQDRSTRRDSQGSQQISHDSPQPTTFVPASQATFPSSAFGTGPFAFGNVMSIVPPNGITNEDDRDRLTGGALLSPEAGEGLIPADLFTSDERPNEDVLPLPGLGALPGNVHLGGQGHDHNDLGPASPASISSSRAASAFVSPQASQQNLPHHVGSPDGLVDTDGRSIRSNRSGAASNANAGSRFSAMFGLRQRPKNLPLDDAIGAPLGKWNSRSLPRQDQGLFGIDSASRRRNSSLSGNVFNISDDPVDDESSPAQNRKRPFTLNPFSKDKTADGWPSSFSPFGKRPVSPRPMSTHSSELPRPSFDSNRWAVDAWQNGDAQARSSPLSLGGWSAPGNRSRIFGSRSNSQRASNQQIVSGQPEDILEAEDSGSDERSDEPLPPIGTKPGGKRASKQIDAKLNPNAKDFKSFLSSMRLRDRERDKSKGASTPTAENMPPSHDRTSPTQSRMSRDARSTTTLESSPEPRRPSAELVLSPTYSNSEAAYSPHIGSNTAGKESFMQKITRKSSSGKFSLPTFKRDKPRLERDASVSGSPIVPPAEDDEDALSTSMSSLKEPRESSEKVRSGARGWSNVLKLGKKKTGAETPSVSDFSIASEATGDEELDVPS